MQQHKTLNNDDTSLTLLTSSAMLTTGFWLIGAPPVVVYGCLFFMLICSLPILVNSISKEDSQQS